MKQQIQFCTTHDGIRIALAKAGEGPPLVRTANWFTHLELDWDSAIWRHWFEALADGREAFDVSALLPPLALRWASRAGGVALTAYGA